MTNPATPTAMSVGTTKTIPPKPPRTTSNANTTAASCARNVDEIPAATPATTSAWTNAAGQRRRVATDEARWAPIMADGVSAPSGIPNPIPAAAPPIATAAL